MVEVLDADVFHCAFAAVAFGGSAWAASQPLYLVSVGGRRRVLRSRDTPRGTASELIRQLYYTF